VSEPARLHPDDVIAIAHAVEELQRARSELERHETDPLLTARQAAELLGFSERYVWRLGRDGVLPRVKVPGRKYVRFPRSGVLAYRDLGYQGPAREPRSLDLPPDASKLARRARPEPQRKRF
jgi:excisionase family DNA binding protein